LKIKKHISPMERRIDLRYRIPTPAFVSWQNVQDKRPKVDGITRDIGTKNAYIETLSCPPVDTVVEIEIILPYEIGVSTELRVTGAAIVIRIDRTSRNDPQLALQFGE
jgi:hypothetical protein